MQVIKIGAVWCSGCLVMGPRWKEIEKELPWLKTQYYDFDQDKNKIKKYKVDQGRLPCFIFLDKKEKEIQRITGEVSKKDLLTIINRLKDK
ncbi:thioredoxin family protein [Patescibacteria group bacterium]|nr:thioredoxin family protein [Patescibacteria group bacterium]